jgi:hypothetical protein
MNVLAGAGATVTSNGGDRVTVEGLAAAQVAELLVGSRVRLEELVSGRATLEEAYFSLTRDTATHASRSLEIEEAPA